MTRAPLLLLFAAACAAPGPRGTADAGGQRTTAVDHPIAVVFAIGESGMHGRGDPAEVADLLPDYPPADGVSLIRLDLTVEPLAEPTGDNSPGVGPAGFFAAMLHDECSVDVVLANVGLSGRRSDEWLPGTPLHDRALSRLRGAMALTGAELWAVIHFDGLNDAAYGPPSWDEHWTETEAAIREEAGAPDAPWIYAHAVGAPTQYEHMPAVLEQQEAWQSEHRIMVELPEGPWKDGSHLATAGSLELARRYFAAWLEHAGCP